MIGANYLKAWLPFAVVCAVVLGRALTATAPELAPAADDAVARQAFLAIAAEEIVMRRESAKDFPTDWWSRDDAFHQREWRRAKDWAGQHRVRPGDVLAALDGGLRGHWPHGNAIPLHSTTPPCRPRAIY